MIMINLFKKEGNAKPYFQKERHPCPFYGFHLQHDTDIMIDQNGNQCAIVIISYCPCQMEEKGKEPNWYKCSFNNLEISDKFKEKFEIFSQKIKVFLEEFHHPNSWNWEGISLEQWISHILKTNDILKQIK